MDRTELEIMITLIEGEYLRNQRNTPFKMRALIKKEFGVDVSPTTILNVVGLDEDYERESRRIDNY